MPPAPIAVLMMPPVAASVPPSVVAPAVTF
jgi:hypothetical protein